MNPADTSNNAENGFFWKDLSETKIIPGTYNCGYSPGVAVGCHPMIKGFEKGTDRDLTGWYAGNSGGYIIAGSANTYPLYRKNGNFISATTGWWGQGFLNVIEAMALDTKFDDGKAGTGSVTTSTFDPWYNFCVTNNTQADGATVNYNVSADPKLRYCAVQFWLDN